VGKLDIVHNNVGISGRGTVVEAEEELWDRVMAVNVKSMMLMGKYAVPAMPSGRAVRSSIFLPSRPSSPGLTPYSASKGPSSPLPGHGHRSRKTASG